MGNAIDKFCVTSSVTLPTTNIRTSIICHDSSIIKNYRIKKEREKNKELR